jgi:hypothetical protein
MVFEIEFSKYGCQVGILDGGFLSFMNSVSN